MLIGQGIVPERYHPLVNMLSEAEIVQMREGTRAVLDRAAAAMPMHANFITGHCRAGLDHSRPP